MIEKIFSRGLIKFIMCMEDKNRNMEAFCIEHGFTRTSSLKFIKDLECIGLLEKSKVGYCTIFNLTDSGKYVRDALRAIDGRVRVCRNEYCKDNIRSIQKEIWKGKGGF